MCEAVYTNMAARVANNALDAWLCVRLQICSALLVGALAFSAVLFHILALKGVHTLSCAGGKQDTLSPDEENDCRNTIVHCVPTLPLTQHLGSAFRASMLSYVSSVTYGGSSNSSRLKCRRCEPS